MRRTAVELDEFGEEIGELECESFGSTMDTRPVWWNPETKKKYLYLDLGDEAYFQPYEGPVIHGTGYTF